MSEHANKQSEHPAAPAAATAPDAPVGKRTLVEAAYAPAGHGVQRSAKPATSPVWVEFDTKGNWTAAQVLATLASQVAVPDDLKAAIQAGSRATASYCVALRDRLGASEHDETKKQQISNALTSRITELFYATPQSPLQYSQLAEVARWADQYKAAGAATLGTTGGAATDKPAQGATAGKGDAAAAVYATQLASQPGGRVRDDDKDTIRTAAFQVNDEHKGEESGNTELAGWSFLRDPFDNTVTATRPASTATDDNAGLQFTFQVEKGAGGAAGKATLVRTITLSKLRIGALKRQDKMAPIEIQETEAQKNTRLANDTAMNVRDRKYDTDHETWVSGGKQGPEPQKPAGYLAVPHRNTLCVRTPGDVYGSAGGTSHGGFNFDPRLQQKATPWAWRTLDANPEGPRAGDVYYLWDVTKNQAGHMGVFKSAAPVAGSEGLYTWVVTDGGQGGGYEQIQQAQERTRGPFNKKTGLFSSSIAEAGQDKGDRRLVGWVDIDAYNQGKPDAQTVST